MNLPHIQHMTDAFTSLAHRKLLATVPSGTRDTPSLHRWVLLKNSVTSLRPSSPDAASISLPEDDEDDWDSEQDQEVVESYSFVFPDTVATCCDFETSVAEAEWLDALLEKLGEEDDISEVDDPHTVGIPTDDSDVDNSRDSDPLPILAEPPLLLPPTYPPYPYPPTTSSLLYGSALPYPDYIPRVPDAIEDTSDDESETTTSGPITPFGRSMASLADNSLRPSVEPRVYELPVRGAGHFVSDTRDAYYHPFETDSIPDLPFHQEC